MTSFGVGKILVSDLHDLLSCLKSHTSHNFSSFSSLAPNPARDIHCAASFASMCSITPDFSSFITSFLTFSPQCSGVFLGFLTKKRLGTGLELDIHRWALYVLCLGQLLYKYITKLVTQIL